MASNNVSIADPGFCDTFVSIHRRLFNTGDRVDHARQRKIVSHICSQKSVLEFEPIARLYIDRLLKQRDRLYDAAVKGGLAQKLMAGLVTVVAFGWMLSSRV